jgi:excisionase family DNA binding protein
MTDQHATAPHDGAAARPELLEALTQLLATLSPPPQPAPSLAGDVADFLTTGQIARRLGVSRETVRRLAIADVLPHAVMCQGARKTTRRFPRRFADDFAASGLDVADLAGFATRWRASVAGSR